MKKWAILLVLALVISITAACGTEDVDDPPPDDQEIEESMDESPDIEEPDDEDTAEVPVEEPDDEDPGLQTDDHTFVIGEAIVFDDFEMTITELKVIQDEQGEYGLLITFDWINNGTEAVAPRMTFTFTGYQDNVETDTYLFLNDVDYEPGLTDVEPGGEVIGAHTTLYINDMDRPFVLELMELFAWEDVTYTYVIEDLNEYK